METSEKFMEQRGYLDFVNFQGLAGNFIPHNYLGMVYLTRNMEEPDTIRSVLSGYCWSC